MKEQPRKRLKKGTVLSEWQDEHGQWWRTTVVKDTATVFKCITRKIDAPSSEGDGNKGRKS
jgi:hypothetical protein